MDTFKKIGAFIRTVKHLKLSQVVARIDYKIRCIYYLSPLYPFLEDKLQSPHNLLLTPPSLWEGNKHAGEKIEKSNLFKFINQEINFGENIKWEPQEASALWIYNLHYFEWVNDLKTLNKKGQIKAVDLTENWLNQCNHFNKTTWHPYPLSLRIINWLTHYHFLTETMSPTLKEIFNQSLMRQAEHLNNNLEWDVEGNHLIKNLKAMIYVGLCLPGHQTAYLEAIDALIEQLKVQINPDGGHYEKSPHYHVDVLVDLLDIAAIIRKAGQTPPNSLTDAIDRMALAFDFYRYKDKKLGLFNDGSIGEKKKLDAIWKRCRMIEKKPLELPDTGYIRMEKGHSMFMMDVGRCCPDTLPAHAHADTLSFEYCYGTERVFVNCGTYAYQHKKRNILRGTAAHNTVSIDGQNSAEIWSTFRIGRRPKNVIYTLKEEDKVGVGVNASHDGYKYINATHDRKVFLSNDGMDIRGEDIIQCRENLKTLVHFHLHPDMKCKILNTEEAEITTPKNVKIAFKIKGGRLYDAGSEYAPEFGKIILGKQLVIKGNYRQNTCTIKWAMKILEEG